MRGNLRPCVDCNKELSVMAKECNQCNSTDPFGYSRKKDQLQLMGIVMLLLIFLVIGALWHFDIIEPVELLKSFFN